MKKIFTFLLFFIFICFFASEVFASGTVDINAASLAQLDTLTGIGPKYAQAIIDDRPFSSVDDLLRVKGIGPATLQKIKDQGLAYVSGQAPQGSAAAENLAVENNTTPSETPAPEAIEAIAEASNAPSYPAGIFINEILPNPAGPDETEEWVELYNSNSSDVDLSGWQLQDIEGTIITYTINPSADSTGSLQASSGQAKILANGFLVFKRSDTKIMLNNDKDGLNLFTPDKKIVDSMTFTKAPLDQSYNKTNSGWQWSLALTPGNKNVITSANVLPKAKNSVKNDGIEQGLAGISQIIDTNQDIPEGDKTSNPWFLFFTVLAVTIILATIVLFIKIKFKNYERT